MVIIPGVVRAPIVVMVVIVMPAGIMNGDIHAHSLPAMLIAAGAASG
jgi:hypothetical protein